MNLVLRASILLLVLAGAPATAFAQDASDPIGNILDQVGQPAPATPTPPLPVPAPRAPPPAVARPTPAPPVAAPYPYGPRPQIAAPYAPSSSAYAPPPPNLSPSLAEPVFVDEYDRTPDRPMNSAEQGYENRMRSSFAAAQGMQGPLDGAWTLRSDAGQAVYTLLLVDKNNGRLEGAWRDPRRPGSRDSSGFLAAIQKIGTQLTASFYPSPGAGAVTLTLTPLGNGEWTGELTEGGARLGVVMSRD